MIILTVPGRPQSWKAPLKGKHTFYTPEGVKTYQYQVQLNASIEYKGPLLDGRIRLDIELYTDFRADISNIVKAIEDALQGIIYHNDRQVDEIHVKRIYTKTDMKAVIKVEVTECK